MKNQTQTCCCQWRFCRSKHCRWRCLAVATLLGATLLFCVPASAENHLRNGDFEEPLGPANWTILNLAGVPDDFDVKDRTKATAVGGSLYGFTFRPLTLRLTHACLTQTATNLTPDHAYTVSGWMIQGWWEGTNNAKRDKYLVFIEAIGGQGTPTADGRASVIATTPPDADIDAPYTYPTAIWRQFTAQQIPDTNGNIEVRFHYNKVAGVTYDKTWIMGAGFDDVALTP